MSKGSGNGDIGVGQVKRNLVVPNIHDFAGMHFQCKDAADELDALEDATPTQRGLALLLRCRSMEYAMQVDTMEQQQKKIAIARPNIITPRGGFGRT